MASKSLSRKAFLKLAASGAFTGALAACTGAPAPSAPPAQEGAAEATAAPTAEGEAAAGGAASLEELPTPTPQPVPEGGKVIRMYAQGLTPRERLETERWDPPKEFLRVRQEYQDAHPSTVIEFVPQMTTGYEEWLVTQMTGGTAPEIVWYQRGYISRDYAKGWFVNLDPYLAEPNSYIEGNQVWKDAFQGPVIASGTAPDGHIYMITGDIVGTGLFYNKTMFDEAGVTAVPETWEQFKVAMQAIKDNTGKWPMVLSMDLAGGVQLWGSWTTRIIQDVLYDHKMGYIKTGQEGTTVERTWKPGENLPPSVMVPAILAGRYGATDPEWKEMLRILKDWSQYWNEGFWSLPTSDVHRMWATKEAALSWQGSWMNKPILNDPLIDFEWGIFPKIPQITKETSEFGGIDFPAMAGVGGVFQYAIPSEAERRGVLNETIDWMRWITAPKNLIALLNDHGGFAPGTVDTTGADPKLSVYTDMMVKYGTERIEPFDSMLTREFVDTMWNQLQQFLAGQIELDTMAENIQGEMMTAAESLLAEHPEWAEGA